MSYFTLTFFCIIGIVNGIFDDNRYRSNPKATVLQSVDVLGLGSGAAMIKKLKYAQYVSSGIVFVRELVNSPANILTPGLLLSIFYFVYLSFTFLVVVNGINTFN